MFTRTVFNIEMNMIVPSPTTHDSPKYRKTFLLIWNVWRSFAMTTLGAHTGSPAARGDVHVELGGSLQIRDVSQPPRR